jgi:DNA-binding MarR family transcriptional regulator
MDANPDEFHLAAWRNFLTAHAAVVAKIERDLAHAKRIPLTWYDVLIELHEAPERRLRLSELADAVVLSRSGITRLVDRLETAGLLRREPHPIDGRGAYAVLTADGLEALRAAWPVYASGIQEHFAKHLTRRQTSEITAGLQRVIDASGDAE